MLRLYRLLKYRFRDTKGLTIVQSMSVLCNEIWLHRGMEKDRSARHTHLRTQVDSRRYVFIETSPWNH